MNAVSIVKETQPWSSRWNSALRNGIGYGAAVFVRFKAVAPYALIELALPGGSVMALLLWLYRRRKHGAAFGAGF